MEHAINQVLEKIPETSDIHAKHHALYRWKHERKAKKLLHQSRQLAKQHRQQFLDEQIMKSYLH